MPGRANYAGKDNVDGNNSKGYGREAESSFSLTPPSWTPKKKKDK